MVTLKQIADKAGVTPATVSMALRNHKRISAARRAQILQIATELGWERNSHVSSLMQHIRRARQVPERATLALLMAHPMRDARSRFYCIHRLFEGMERGAVERGYRTEVFWYNDPKVAPERLFRILYARGIQGIAVAPFRELNSIRLDWSRFAVSQSGVTQKGGFMHRALEDYFFNMLIVLSHLWASGYRRISLVWPSYHQAVGAALLLTGCYARFFEMVASPRGWKKPCLITPQWTREGFLTWFEKHRPDAVVTTSWDVLEWLQQAGYEVPGQVGIGLLNHCPSDPRFAGVDPLPERIGATVVDLLIDQLEQNQVGPPAHPKLVLTRGQWRPGSTVRPPVGALPIDVDELTDIGQA